MGGSIELAQICATDLRLDMGASQQLLHVDEMLLAGHGLIIDVLRSDLGHPAVCMESGVFGLLLIMHVHDYQSGDRCHAHILLPDMAFI